MELNTQKEEFSYAYIHAVASAAGYSFQMAPRSLDIVGVDAVITSPSSPIRPRIEMQVKCTSNEISDKDFIRYPLSIKNYNDLRAKKVNVPRLLVVVVVPERLEDWLHQSEIELCLQRCGYWLSLRGMPETQNAESVTVYLPRQNQFTVEALTNMMQQIEIRGIL